MDQLKSVIEHFIEQMQTGSASLSANAWQRLQTMWQKLVAFLQVLVVVARLQCAMAARRAKGKTVQFVHWMKQQAQSRYDAFKQKLDDKFGQLHEAWCSNQHFTFWFIPADGQNIARTHVKKTHLKYAFSGIASFLVVVSVTIGVLAHFALQNEAQKQEIAEFKATKQAQDAKIEELQKIADNNQQQLAYLSKLEDQVRTEMQKNGTTLPPKSAIEAQGQGGPSLGDGSKVGMMMEQEKNITAQVQSRKADFENLLSTIENENYRKDVTPSLWPTSGGEVTSSFGGRRNPFGGYGGENHPGIDIGNDYGAPVYATAAGYVQQAGWYGGYGNYVRLSHDYGIMTAYGHMSRVVVSAGSYVKKGDIIGYVGSTGYSTGPHLHYEVMENGEQVNPSKYL